MRTNCTASIATLALAAGVAHGGLVDPALDAVLREAGPNEIVSVLVFHVDQVDLTSLSAQLDTERASRRKRHEVVIRALQATAAFNGASLRAHLGALQQAGRIERFNTFWIANIARMDAPPAEIAALSARADVDRVYLNYAIAPVAPVEGDASGVVSEGGVEPGVEAVRAPDVWALGIDGAGTVVATIDFGVDGNHPALADRWRGVADPRYADNPGWAWFDPFMGTDFPRAYGSHGTHTMGSVCGGPPGEQIGVAPGAQWIHAVTVDRETIEETVADILLGFEWMVDPDGDPETSFDVPDVCSNSWGFRTQDGFPECEETFWSFLDACEAVGTVILFSAGNEGNAGLRRPADRATDDYRTLAVAAVNANIETWPIAGFSSRGPTTCTPDGSEAIKPDISAPGVSVRSAIPGGGYGFASGTSMASPHVNGVVALMLQANSGLGVEEIKQILYDTAFDLGAPGEDNAYGHGMVDAFEAVQAALRLRCDGDIDGSEEVDFDDILAVLAAWGPVKDCPPFIREDIDQDCDVGFSDLLVVLATWGPCP